jgi:hypothetical protein
LAANEKSGNVGSLITGFVITRISCITEITSTKIP